MFRYPEQLPADLAPYGAHDTQRGWLAPPAVVAPAVDEEDAAEYAELTRYGRITQCWAFLAVCLVLAERARLAQAPAAAAEPAPSAPHRPADADVVVDGRHLPPSPAVAGPAAIVVDEPARGPSDRPSAAHSSSVVQSSLEVVPAAAAGDDAVDARPFNLSGPNPLDIPELREIILSFVKVDSAFDAGLLRTSRGFLAHFHPRLYRVVNLTGPKRKPLAFVRALEGLSQEDLGALRVKHLQLRVRDEDRAEDLLPRLLRLLRKSEPFSAAIPSLAVFLCFPVDADDDDADAKQLADIVAACAGLTRLVLRDWCALGLYNGLMDRLLACHPAAVLKRLERLTVELPPEAFLFRDKATLSEPPQVRTVRTFFVAPKDAPTAYGMAEISVSLLATVIRYMDGVRPEAKTLVLGPSLASFVGQCAHAVKLEVALAERIARDKLAERGCRVVFPAELAVAGLLDADPTFVEVGLMTTIVLWESGMWPDLVDNAALPVVAGPVEAPAEPALGPALALEPAPTPVLEEKTLNLASAAPETATPPAAD